MSDAAPAPGNQPHGTDSLPRDMTEEELEAAPILESVDTLLIEDLTDDEASAFFDALDS